MEDFNTNSRTVYIVTEQQMKLISAKNEKKKNEAKHRVICPIVFVFILFLNGSLQILNAVASGQQSRGAVS